VPGSGALVPLFFDPLDDMRDDVARALQAYEVALADVLARDLLAIVERRASDGDSADLACVLAPDLVVVVADAGLGAINAVRLAVVPFAGQAVAVALNRFDDDALHRANRDVLVADGIDVYTGVGAFADRVAAIASGS